MKNFLSIILYLCASLPFAAKAQNDLEEPQLLYRKRIMYGANVNSAGLGGINFKFGKQKTALIKNLFEIEFARLRHPKEERVFGQSDNPKKYTPGRINMAFFLRAGYGQNLFITDRMYKNSVSLHYNYAFGPTLALLKPIFIEVLKESPNNPTQAIIATERYDPVNEHTFPLAIYGNASFNRGLNLISPRLGGYFRNSLSIEWGQYPDEFRSLEAGFVVDAFATELPLMAPELANNNQFFFTLFLTYYFGQNR
ncbi:MAG: hypothetical protein MUC81_08005 [Bacteroidia bacterium]|nr:hypothetical protein [Bacteroidia bacterium]